MHKIIIIFHTLSIILLLNFASADTELDHALLYATANSAVATSSAIALKKAGFETQTINTPYGLVTTIKDDTDTVTATSQTDRWQKQQAVYAQRKAFMSDTP